MVKIIVFGMMSAEVDGACCHREKSVLYRKD